jgi:hypothetical protein
MAGKKTYNINLDPAVLEVNFPANIDIRDSVKYKNIMKSYKLGSFKMLNNPYIQALTVQF